MTRGRVLALGILAVVVVIVAGVAATVVPSLVDPGVAIAGAGDIAGCGSAGAVRTASLLDGMRPDAVFTLGDNAYPNGADADFACFDASWGRFKEKMLPAVGNHEYVTPGAAGYFKYFGAVAGVSGYYATDVGAWRIYVLNSECSNVSCAESSPQMLWLKADLAAHPHECSLAIWHEPRFSAGPHGNQPAVGPFWDALYAAGNELVLNGHDHLYERFNPVDPSERLDADHGMTEIVAGTGGIGEVSFVRADQNLVVGDDKTSGVLELTLHSNRYSWRFVPVAGATFTDGGSRACHGAPSASTILAATHAP